MEDGPLASEKISNTMCDSTDDTAGGADGAAGACGADGADGAKGADGTVGAGNGMKEGDRTGGSGKEFINCWRPRR